MGDISPEPPTCPGHVNQIRRQWAVHEDEALAYRLQNEEITQHYSGNRTRNAIVREDVPRAKEEQEREERRALAERFKQLDQLQQQAEEDARIARLLAEAESAVGRVNIEGTAEADALEDSDFDILDSGVPESEATGALGAEGLTLNELGLDELKRLQEERDEKLARKLQDEMEQLERDKQLAVEAQDRELAKMLYVKEKAKIKRAKERAKLKAEAAAGGAKQNEEDSNEISPSHLVNLKRSPVGISVASPSEVRSPLHRHASHPARMNAYTSPPKVPEKSRSLDTDDPVQFRAVPKPQFPLPTHPSSESPSSSNSSASQSRRYAPNDPVPPYMPMHGFKISSKRK